MASSQDTISPSSVGSFLSSHLLQCGHWFALMAETSVGFKANVKGSTERTRLNKLERNEVIHNFFFLICFYNQLVEFSLWIILQTEKKNFKTYYCTWALRGIKSSSDVSSFPTKEHL